MCARVCVMDSGGHFGSGGLSRGRVFGKLLAPLKNVRNVRFRKALYLILRDAGAVFLNEASPFTDDLVSMVCGFFGLGGGCPGLGSVN